MMGDFVRTEKEVVAAYLKCYKNVPRGIYGRFT